MFMNSFIISVIGFLLLLKTDLISAQQAFIQKGNASFYADRFHGQRTANGEKYDKTALTAAHRKLAFGSVVKVTNISNGKSIEVRINDRGPYHSGRVIDLSRKGAELLDFIAKGTTEVTVELLTGPGILPPKEDFPLPEQINVAEGMQKPGYYSLKGKELSEPKGFSIQVAAFNLKPNAVAYGEKLEKLNYSPVYLKLNSAFITKVFVGEFKHRHGAEKFLHKLEAEGIEGIIRALPE